MKLNILFSIIFILLFTGLGQATQAASHSSNQVTNQTFSTLSTKQANKLKKLEKKKARKERRKTKWGNLALILGGIQVALFATAVIVTLVVMSEAIFTILALWSLWSLTWIPSMIFSIVAMGLADTEGNKKERNKAIIAFFLGLVPIGYGAFKIIEFTRGL